LLCLILLSAVNANAATFTVTNTAGTGAGSLNQAIINANSNAGPDTIEFSIPPFDGTVKTIAQSNNLTDIIGPTIINGFSQPGSSSNTLATGNNALLLIGINTPTANPGLNFQTGGNTVRGVIINGNGSGIFFQSAASNNLIEGCFIGTDSTGTTNGSPAMTTGLNVQSFGNQIGGTNPGARNVIGGCINEGIILSGIGASNNVIVGNYIGTDKNGTGKVANGNGVSVTSASSNLIGGATASARNILSGNTGSGVALSGAGGRNVVQGNYIGTDVTGLLALGNLTGVSVSSATNTIGGVTGTLGAPPGNLISGNTGQGISLGGGSGHIVQGNLVGTTAAGTADLGNGSQGILLNVLNSVVSNNVVSGNNQQGIQTTGSGGSRNWIVGNWIGTDVSGALNLSNNSFGVQNGGGFNNVCSNNVIAFNGDHGVHHAGVSSTNNTITGNSMYSNAKLGINLFVAGDTTSGATSNDVCDADSAVANLLQNYPVLSSANSDNDSVTIAGLLDSVASRTYTLEFFANDICDPSGHGEGKDFLGSTNVMTGANCTNNFSVTFPVAVANGKLITATATDPTGNTSEFSRCITNQTLVVMASCSLAPATDTNTVGTLHTVTSTVTTNGGAAAGVTVFFRVTAGPNLNDSASSATDGAGQANFPYTGDGGTGTDTIMATGIVSGVSFSCSATKLWAASNQPPVAVCRNVTNAAGANCQASVAATAVDNGSSDPDGSIVTRTLTPPGPFPLGNTAVTLTVVDDDGASNSCAAVVTVIDTTPPTITQCASNVTGTVNASCQATVPNMTGGLVATDNCTASNALVVTQSPTVGTTVGLGTNLVVLTVRDAANNAAVCTNRFIVRDVTPPVVGCSDNVVSNVAAPATSTPVTFPLPTLVDDCGVVTNFCLPASGSVFSLGTSNVTCKAVDTSGNTNTCLFTVTVNQIGGSNQPPVAMCQNVTNAAGANCQASVAATAVDNGSSDPDGSIVTRTLNPPGPFPLGNTPVTLTVVDDDGASNSCAAVVTVIDTTPPMITQCASNQVASANTNCQAAVPNMTGGLVATDNCTASNSLVVTQNPVAGAMVGLGSNAVVITVTDAANNNSSCTNQFVVVDTTPPTIACAGNVISNVVAPANSAVVTYAAPTVGDNCAVLTNFCAPASGSVFPLGMTTVTCTAVDTSGNTNTCTFTVTVNPISGSNQPPVAVCSNLTRAVESNCTANVSGGEVDGGSFDPDGMIASRSLAPAGPYPVGQTPVTLTVTDNGGAMASCMAIITVVETNLPSITCPANVVTTVPPPQTSAMVMYPLPDVEVECSMANVFCVPRSGASFPLGMTTVNCFAVDGPGNSNSCSFQVTVQQGAPGGNDLTVSLANPSNICSNGPKGTVCTGMAALGLANNGSGYGMGSFNLVSTCRTKKGATTCKVTGAINFTSFNLGSNPTALLGLYLSNDAVFDPGDTKLMKKEVSTAALGALFAKNKALRLKPKPPKGTSLSGKFLILVIDAINAVPESNDGNNFAVFGPLP